MTQVDPQAVATQGVLEDELALASQGFILGEGSGSQIRNRIITRGFGPSRGKAGRVGPVTQGYGGPSSYIVEIIRRNLDVRRRFGGSSNKERFEKLYPIVVWAKLISVNEIPPKRPVEGFTTVATATEKSVMTEAGFISTRVKKAWQTIRIAIKRIS